MCVNKTWILNKYNGQKYFVKCGHCPACLQEKAIKRTNRIRANKNDVGVPKDVLFVTLTYENKFIPYISRFQVNAFLNGFIDSLDIKRDFTSRKVSDFKGRVVRQVKKLSHNVLYSFKPELNVKRESLLTPNIPLVGVSTKVGTDNFVQDINKIGVPYLPDIQNFIKRFRINFFRKFGYEEEMEYFYVCELGPYTFRPHFHLLIYVKNGWYNAARKCVIESWPFGRFFEKSIERAIRPEAYVSSYVNSNGNIPDFFFAIKQFHSFHHYSKNLGFGKSNFSLRGVYDAFMRNDFGFVETTIRDGVLTRNIIPIPLYVINKYFRKFKGFSRLTSDEIYRVAQCPASIGAFRERIEAEDSELRTIYNALNNLHSQYIEYFKDDESVLPFPYVYSRIWFAYNAYKLKHTYEQIVSDFDVLQLFDNLSECFYFMADGETKGFIRHEGIKSIINGSISYFPFPSDPNLYPSNINKNSSLTLWHEKYKKVKKERNMVYQIFYM